MTPTQPRLQRSSLALILLLSAVLAVLMPACGAKQHTGEPVGPLHDDGIAYPHLRATNDGRIVVDKASKDLRRAQAFVLQPHQWDPAFGPIPTVGTGRLVRQSDALLAVQVATAQTTDINAFRVVPADALQPLSHSKLIGTIETYDNDALVTLTIPDHDAVAPGDLYFVLTTSTLDRTQPRMGDMIGGILRVVEADSATIRASVVHHIDPIAAGQTVVFAQARPLHHNPDITLLAAALQRDAHHDPNTLPPLMAAMPEFLARYELSNIHVQALDTFIDPRPWDASITADEATPDDAWGMVVFGDIDGNTLIYNATGFGAAPSPDSTVGILAGGLPIAFDGKVEDLSPQLVPSFIANGLGLRGDHALAVYILEAELRSGEFDPLVRYHLREHLALRYHSIGDTREALRLMNHDIRETRAANNTYPLLNALSIREHLDQEGGLVEQWLADGQEFIRTAEGVLPEDAIDLERASHVRALLASQKFEDAESLAAAIVARAEAKQDKRMLLQGLVALGVTQIARKQPEAALLVLSDLEAAIDAYPKETQVSLRLLGAELRVGLEMYPEALEAMMSAFDDFDAVSTASRASMLERGAAVLTAIDRPIEAARAIADAAELYTELGLLEPQARLRALGGQKRLELASAFEGTVAFRLIVEARIEFSQAVGIYLRLGRTLEAANYMAYVALLDGQLQEMGSSDALFDRAKELALASGSWQLLAEIAEARAQLYHNTGQKRRADFFRAEAEQWAAFGELEMDFPPFSDQAE